MRDLQNVYRERGIREDDRRSKINLLYELMPGTQRVLAACKLKDIEYSGGGLADRHMSLEEVFGHNEEAVLAHLERVYENSRKMTDNHEKVFVSPELKKLFSAKF